MLTAAYYFPNLLLGMAILLTLILLPLVNRDLSHFHDEDYHEDVDQDA